MHPIETHVKYDKRGIGAEKKQTPAYVSPEVITKKGYDRAKVDIWSCGVILFVLLAGHLPFQDANLMVMYKKIYKGDFKCPPWFSSEVRRLVLRLLDPNPKTRISTCLNALDIISLSPGFNLSGLFNDVVKQEESRFTSTQPASSIMSKLEEIASLFRFNFKKSKDCKVKLQGSEQGRKGHLSIDAEIFEVTPSLFVVELRKTGGDSLEYSKFYSQDLKPGLKDIVWTWDGNSQ